MQPMPFFRLLEPGSGDWSGLFQGGGFAQIFRQDSTVANGAFAFSAASGLAGRLPQLIPQLSSGSERLEVKLVVHAAARAEAEAEFRKAGVAIRKTVSRAGPFELRYCTGQGKILVADCEAAGPAPRKIRVLIVDDYPTIRKVLKKILSADSEIEVVGECGLPSEVEGAIGRLRPDVVTLDIHLPEMNGVELLKRYLPKFRVPTVMISSISVEEGPLVLNALEAGAVDYIQKPGSQEIAAVSPFILLKVKTAAKASLQKNPGIPAERVKVEGNGLDLTRVVAIGSSTGGTEALKEVFLRLPESIPPILVVQHIPAVFSKAFAERLNQLCPFEVLEGTDGMEVRAGRVIIAPGGFQMKARRQGAGHVISIEDTAPVNRHKPSVDVLMESVAKTWGNGAIGLILTGMGADGAAGLLEMKKAGAVTLVQDEASCVVFGMPQAALKVGAAEKAVSLPKIAEEVVRSLKLPVRAKSA